MITFYYLISMTIKERLDIHLMDVEKTYLYEKLDNDIYIKIPIKTKDTKDGCTYTCNIYLIKL